MTRLCIVLGGHWDVLMGGAQYQAKCLLDALAHTADFETYYLAQAVPENLKHWPYEIVPFGSLETRTKGLTALPSLYSRLKALKPDVVYQRCLMPYTGACAFYASRNDARFVFHVASDDDVTPLKPGAAMVHRVARTVEEACGTPTRSSFRRAIRPASSAQPTDSKQLRWCRTFSLLRQSSRHRAIRKCCA